MKKLTLFGLLWCVASMNAFAVDEGFSNTPSRNLLPLACNIAHSTNLDSRVKCLNNARVLIKHDINNNYKKLGSRDRTHLLNTKALELQLQSNACEKLIASDIVKIECKIQADLSLLSYMELRYEL